MRGRETLSDREGESGACLCARDKHSESGRDRVSECVCQREV